jgi:succinate dehydrogenase / fumarate reductase flavoprotein subunit
VTRPGGAALNAGQVFGARCAEHIAARQGPRVKLDSEQALISEAVATTLGSLRVESGLKAAAVRKVVQDRMSDHAAILCNASDVKAAADAAQALNEAIRHEGVAAEGANEALRALQWRQSAIASEAILKALDFYLEQGGGSRGARAIISPDGDRVPEARTGALENARFISERDQDRAEQIHVRLEGAVFVCEARPIRRRDRGYRPFFERDWPDYLTGAIHDPPA